MNMTNSERRCTSVPRETNGQDQTTPEHVDLVSCHCLHCKSLKFVLGIPKSSKEETFIGTDSSKLGTGTPTFGTRFHHICTMLYQVPTLWYHGTTTLSPPSCYEWFAINEGHITLQKISYTLCKNRSVLTSRRPIRRSAVPLGYKDEQASTFYSSESLESRTSVSLSFFEGFLFIGDPAGSILFRTTCLASAVIRL